jgi:hypothetical protein
MPADFPVPFNDRRISLSPSAGTTELDFDFPIYDDGDLEVVRTRSGTSTTLTLTTHYTVAINADQEADPGGTVTLVSSSLASDVYVISGETVVERTTDFAQRGPWPAADINEEFDRIIFMIQEMLRDTSTFVIRVDDAATWTIGEVEGTPTASQFLRRNGANTGWEFATVTDDGSVVSASTAQEGIIEIATDVEAQGKSANNKALVPSNLAELGASTTQAGLTEHATDAEFIAKTATDKALVPSNLAARECFSVHKNGSNQTVNSATATTVTWSTELFDVGSKFASNAWTPSAGKAVITCVLTYTSTNGVDNEDLYVSLYKNGVNFQQALNGRNGTGNGCVFATWIVDPNGTDAWTVIAYKAGAGNGAVDGAATNSYFSGFLL